MKRKLQILNLKMTQCVLVMLLLLCISACRQYDSILNDNNDVTQAESSRIEAVLKHSLKIKDQRILVNEMLKGRPFLTETTLLDSTGNIRIIVPVLNSDDLVKGYVNFLIDTNYTIIDHKIIDSKRIKNAAENSAEYFNFMKSFEQNGYKIINMDQHIPQDKKIDTIPVNKGIKDSIKSRGKKADQMMQLYNMEIRFVLSVAYASTSLCVTQNDRFMLQQKVNSKVTEIIKKALFMTINNGIEGTYDGLQFFYTIKDIDSDAKSFLDYKLQQYELQAQLQAYLRSIFMQFNCITPNASVLLLNYSKYTYPTRTTIPIIPVVTAPTAGNINAQISGKPYALIPNFPCIRLSEWINTAGYKPGTDIINKLNNVVTWPGIVPGLNNTGVVARIQAINDASSTAVNMDYFPVGISQMPILNGQRATQQSLTNYVRQNINLFVDPTLAKFAPYNSYGINETALWNSSNPTGAVVNIDIGGPDNGSVIVSRSTPTSWTFTTIYEPLYLKHPVSGNRDFGIRPNNGSFVFYTRGVDRMTTWDVATFQYLHDNANSIIAGPYDKGDELWSSFQRKLADFINSNGGSAGVGNPEILRPDWDRVKEVLEGRQPVQILDKNCN